ncbi:hypothetical protein [Streptomyces sp. NPDC007905]|uniref:hypothetical protein n=1 Tax=Streptomyces sp. NPDC007905 TaxID=3364788 RepID=UPI0036E39EFB
MGGLAGGAVPAHAPARQVTGNEAYGLGSYCCFNVNPAVTAAHAIEAPNTSGVRFTSMVTVSPGGTGTIGHVVNNTAGPSNSATNVANLVRYP